MRRVGFWLGVLRLELDAASLLCLIIYLGWLVACMHAYTLGWPALCFPFTFLPADAGVYGLVGGMRAHPMAWTHMSLPYTLPFFCLGDGRRMDDLDAPAVAAVAAAAAAAAGGRAAVSSHDGRGFGGLIFACFSFRIAGLAGQARQFEVPRGEDSTRARMLPLRRV